MSKEMWASMQERQRAPERTDWQFGGVSPWTEFGVVLPSGLRNGDVSPRVYQHEGTARFGAGIDLTGDVVLEMRAAAHSARAARGWSEE